MATVVELVHPKDLKIDASLKDAPRWDKDDPRFLSLKASIREAGILSPLFVDFENRILEGRHRWWAAVDLQLQQIPILRIPQERIHTVVVASLLNRRHYTQGQLAYLVQPHMESAFEEARRRMLSGVKETSAHSVRRVEKRVDEWAEEIGVSVRLLQQARQVHELFKDLEPRDISSDNGRESETDVSFKEFFEPRILREAEPHSLGDVLTAIKTIVALETAAKNGRAHTGGEFKTQHWQVVRSGLAQFAPEQLKPLTDYHAKMVKELKAQAKRNKAEGVKAEPKPTKAPKKPAKK